MSKENKTPHLRFPEFTGEWKEKSFGELYEKHNVKNDLSFGVDKIISVANMYFKSDAAVGDDEYLKTYNVFRLGDIAYEGHKSANFAYGRFVENTIGDGIVSHVFDVYSPISSDHCIDYWKYAINYERIMRPILEKSTKQSTMMNNLIEKDFLKQKTFVPSLPEQQKIASCISEMDNLITAQGKRVEALKEKKKGLMQRLFPQNGEKTPQLRFPGFEGEWSEKKLGDFLVERREPSVITEELPQLSFTIAEGVIRPEDRKTNKRDFLMTDKDSKTFLVTRLNDIIYNPANVVFGAIHKNNLCDGVVSPIYKIFWTQENADFLNYLFRRPSFISQLATRAEGTVTKLKTLKAEAFLDMSVPFTDNPAEQQKIASCLSELDALIASESAKEEALKNHKKGLMQQLFPQPTK